MKKILFPFDFSKASLNAFEYALHFAKAVDASIVTLHVYERNKSNYVDYYDQLNKNYTIGDWEQLETYKAIVPELNAITLSSGIGLREISHLLENGDPATVICNAAEREKVDFIIMGTVGAHGLAEVFLGSVTEKVINDAPCDVLAIPVAYQYAEPLNLLYLTEYEDFAYRKLSDILGFANLFKAHIDVLEIRSNDAPSYGQILDKWRKKFEGENVDFHVHIGLVADEVVTNFVDLAKTSMIVITAHRKSLLRRVFLYSLSQQLAFHTHVPVLALHEKKPHR
ncbi:MAG: universal stress protein [Flavobacterium sp.]|nr:MAG: universal stress protein [Flavobacterium sp.]